MTKILNNQVPSTEYRVPSAQHHSLERFTRRVAVWKRRPSGLRNRISKSYRPLGAGAEARFSKALVSAGLKPGASTANTNCEIALDSQLGTRHSVLGTRNSPLGFTLIELMIVITIIMILASISIPTYMKSLVHAKEAVLRDDLFTMRNVIDQYTLDKQKAPQSLEDLVSSGYLKAIPKDPFTGSSDTWQTTSDDTLMDPGQTQPGITDVHSGASGVGSDGTPYSSW